MTRILLLASSLIALAAFAAVSTACDSIQFSAGACYSQSYAAPQAYVQQQVFAAPQVYAYTPPAQYFAAPARVEIVKPEVRIQLQQAQPYYAPQVVQQFAVKSYAAPAFVQKQLVQKQVVVKQPIVVQQRARLFGGGRSVQRSFSRSVIRN